VVGISSKVRLIKPILLPIFAHNLDCGRARLWEAFRCARRWNADCVRGNAKSDTRVRG